MIFMNVVYTVKDGKREEFYNELCERRIGEKSKNDLGNIIYEYYFSTENLNNILLVEYWSDEQALKSHIEAAHCQELQALKKDYVVNTEIVKASNLGDQS